METDENIKHDGQERADKHIAFVAYYFAESSGEKMTEAIAPEKGRGYYAHSGLVYAEVCHHAAYDHIDVLSSVIEEQVHNYEAP